MPELIVPNDAVATVPFTFTDALDRPAPVPAGLSVDSSDGSVVVAQLSADGTSFTVTPVGNGTATVTPAAPNVAIDPVSVTVSDPAAVKGVADVAGATFSPKP